MSASPQWAADLLDGQLADAQENELAALLREDPAAVNELVQELQTNDLIARVYDPKRSDALFLGALGTRLDIDLGNDPNDTGPDDGGPDGDAPDGQGLDGQGLDGQGLDGQVPDGIDGSTGLESTLPDPASVSSAASSGGTAAATGGGAAAATGSGVLSWVVSGAIGVALGTAALVMKEEPNVPSPPASTLPSLPQPQAVTRITPSDDISVYARWKPGEGKQPTLEVFQEVWYVKTRQILMKFDLSTLPKNFTDIRLRLYAVETGTKIQPLQIHKALDDWAEDKITTYQYSADFLRGHGISGEPISTWEPIAGRFWEIDVTEAVRTELAGDGIISFAIRSQLELDDVRKKREHRNPEAMIFASREHENPDWHPVLLIQTPAESTP